MNGAAVLSFFLKIFRIFHSFAVIGFQFIFFAVWQYFKGFQPFLNFNGIDFLFFSPLFFCRSEAAIFYMRRSRNDIGF